MDTTKKTLALGTGTLLALSGAGLGWVTTIQQADAAQPESPAAEAHVASTVSTTVELDHVQGAFSYTQTEVDSNDIIKQNISNAARYLCGANQPGEPVDVAQWQITVDGAVSQPIVAPFSELAKTYGTQSTVMGCACAGNPADGRAAANAEVTGISVLDLIASAQPTAGANTITFTSADGYGVSLPLSYLQNRFCPLVFDINGATLANSVGGTNQLWLGSTAASYFARDVVAITLEERQTPPPSPSSDEARSAYANLPNIGVLFGGEVR